MTPPTTIPTHSNPTPDLRIVDTEKLLPHEHHDRQRLEPLIERFRTEDFLVNPPIVAELDDSHFVVLDGANRTTAFLELGIPHCLVQVVPYEPPSTTLLAHHHLILNMDGAQLDKNIGDIDGLSISEANLADAQEQLAGSALLGYYIRTDGSVALLKGDMGLHQRTELLNRVVDAYRSIGRLERVTTDDMEQLRYNYGDVSALVAFACYEPDEIKQLAASDGHKLPPGITRHIIQGRAIRIHFPIKTLAADRSAEEKEPVLRHWLQLKLRNREVRFYAESTYIFDE